MAIDIITGFNSSSRETLDKRSGPYDSVSVALTSLDTHERYVGLKVIVVENSTKDAAGNYIGGDLIEYIFDGGIADENLVVRFDYLEENGENTFNLIKASRNTKPYIRIAGAADDRVNGLYEMAIADWAVDEGWDEEYWENDPVNSNNGNHVKWVKVDNSATIFSANWAFGYLHTDVFIADGTPYIDWYAQVSPSSFEGMELLYRHDVRYNEYGVLSYWAHSSAVTEGKVEEWINLETEELDNDISVFMYGYDDHTHTTDDIVDLNSALTVKADQSTTYTKTEVDNAVNYKAKGALWTQLGADIDGAGGEKSGDESGNSVSMNATGDIIAIGARDNDGNGSNAGHTRIYQNNSGTWTQIGDAIEGENALDQSGWSVSLNAVGDIVAIGSTYYDSANGELSGYVRIYQNNSGTWTQIGDAIEGENALDRSGGSVSLNAVGDIVAIGARYNDGNGSNAGHTRIYQNINGAWTQIGDAIEGKAADDQSGYSVSLNAAGDIVAIGAPFNDDNGTDSGHTRIYQNINGTWTQIGDAIDGKAAGDQSGHSVSINADGDIVAIGARLNDDNSADSGHTRIYQYTSGAWTQIGDAIDGEAAGDLSGYSVALNSAGDIVAIGAINNDGVNGTDSGHTRIYQNVSGTWTQIGSDIDGDAAGDLSGYSVALNSAGDIVAIGAIYNDGVNGTDSGHVRIFNLSGHTHFIKDVLGLDAVLDNVVTSNDVTNIVKLTQAEYDLGNIDESILYIVSG